MHEKKDSIKGQIISSIQQFYPQQGHTYDGVTKF